MQCKKYVNIDRHFYYRFKWSTETEITAFDLVTLWVLRLHERVNEHGICPTSFNCLVRYFILKIFSVNCFFSVFQIRIYINPEKLFCNQIFFLTWAHCDWDNLQNFSRGMKTKFFSRACSRSFKAFERTQKGIDLRHISQRKTSTARINKNV